MAMCAKARVNFRVRFMTGLFSSVRSKLPFLSAN
jgi:hypothetical protein